MTTAKEVAKYIIKSLATDNLKLQKLLYYSQGVHLVLYDKKPLFDDPIEAWDYGPVIPSVYTEYKKHGFDIILPEDDKPSALTLKEIKAIDMTLECFGKLSGTSLLNQTHSEPPWKDAYCSSKPSNVIPIKTIYTFFKKNLNFTEDDFKV